MPRFHLKQSNRHLTSHAGLALIGQCLEAAQLNLLDAWFPTSQGMRPLDIVKSYTGLLSFGKSDFDAIEAFREYRFFKQALNVEITCAERSAGSKCWTKPLRGEVTASFDRRM